MDMIIVCNYWLIIQNEKHFILLCSIVPLYTFIILQTKNFEIVGDFYNKLKFQTMGT